MAKGTKTHTILLLVMALFLIGFPVTYAVYMIVPGSTPKGLTEPNQVSAVPMPAVDSRVIAPVASPSDSQAVAVADASLAGFPYAPGWPIALPGQIIGTPVVADLEGNGKLDVVAPCVYRNSAMTMAHPHPDATPLLFAFHPDGTPVSGWPVILGSKGKVGRGPSWGGWSSSPSVFRRNGKDELVLLVPGRGVCIVGQDRTIISFHGGDNAVNVPLADFANDGVMDITIGHVAKTVDGDPIPTWPSSRQFRNGYAPCIGDAAGDGQLKLYHLFYTNSGTNYADVVGFDTNGDRLTGWPREIDDPSWLAPVMGDVTGDGKMDVIASYGTHIFAWTWDGEPLPNTTSQGPMVGILKSGLFASTACPALADLDGDGKAEIIVFDSQAQAIRAWHGNGVGVGDEQTRSPTTQELVRSLVASVTGQPLLDGVIAKLPGDFHGVSVVSLGDDPKVMDFFTGTYWVRRFPDGRTTITNMLPNDAEIEWTQPTIADVEGTGLADVIFGLSDGRLFVYRTKLAYHGDRMQWPTANGNFQHTGAWKSASAQSLAASGPLLQFRLVAEAGDTSDADQMVDPISRQAVRVLKTIQLDERDVTQVYPLDQDGVNQIGLDFSDAGSAKFAALTAANINRRLAVVLNGSLIAMPTIRTKISKSAVISGGGADGFTEDQSRAIIKLLNSHLTATTGK